MTPNQLFKLTFKVKMESVRRHSTLRPGALYNSHRCTAKQSNDALTFFADRQSLDVVLKKLNLTQQKQTFVCNINVQHKTRSTGIVHTSAKARLTSVAIRIQIHDLDRHQNLTICSLAHCQPSLKISRKSAWTFLCKVANRQTDRQKNNNDYITSLVEIINTKKTKAKFWHLLWPTDWKWSRPYSQSSGSTWNGKATNVNDKYFTCTNITSPCNEIRLYYTSHVQT